MSMRDDGVRARTAGRRSWALGRWAGPEWAVPEQELDLLKDDLGAEWPALLRLAGWVLGCSGAAPAQVQGLVRSAVGGLGWRSGGRATPEDARRARVAVVRACVERRRAMAGSVGQGAGSGGVGALLPTFDAAGRWLTGGQGAVPLLEGCAELGDAAVLRAATQALPDPHRTVLILADVEGIDEAELAECLLMDIRSVRLTHHEARAALCMLVMKVREAGRPREGGGGTLAHPHAG